MEDSQIIALYYQRSEDAIFETSKKYGRLCRSIAGQILQNECDSEECVSDTWYRAWDLIPPERPVIFSAFLAKLTRNLALDRYRRCSAKKRGGGRTALALEELAECIPDAASEDRVIERTLLTKVLNDFLEGLTREQRRLFLGRYWYLRSIDELAEEYGMTRSKVKMTLLRLRKRLALKLTEEGLHYE